MTNKKQITFYVEPEEYDIIMHNAKAKGFRKAGDYTRNILFNWIANHPCKGIFSMLHSSGQQK